MALREAHTGRVRTRLRPYRRALALAFHPDGRRLALGTEGNVQVIDLESGEVATPKWDIPISDALLAELVLGSPWKLWSPRGLSGRRG